MSFKVFISDTRVSRNYYRMQEAELHGI